VIELSAVRIGVIADTHEFFNRAVIE